MPPTPATWSPTLFVADPSPAFRYAVRMLIAAEAPEWRISGEASGADAALEALARQAPDVILLERVLPERSALDLLAELRVTCPAARVLVTSIDWDPPTVEAALERGADGVLPKTTAADRLVEALRRVARGEVYRPDA